MTEDESGEISQGTPSIVENSKAAMESVRQRLGALSREEFDEFDSDEFDEVEEESSEVSAPSEVKVEENVTNVPSSETLADLRKKSKKRRARSRNLRRNGKKKPRDSPLDSPNRSGRRPIVGRDDGGSKDSPVNENGSRAPYRELEYSGISLSPPGRAQKYIGFEHTPGTGRGIHLSIGGAQPVSVRGSIVEHIEKLGLHLHGLVIRAGTTATGADREPEVDATGRVFGLLPESIRFVRSLAANAMEAEGNLDLEGRPYQFGVVNVLGQEDHARIIRALKTAGKNPRNALQEVIGQSGIPTGTKISSVLYNDMGQPFAIGVTFPDKGLVTIDKTGKKVAQHLIFLHSTKAIGGGKSDEKLMDGELGFECKSMSKEFEWWIGALGVTGGKIGGIESTIGGTARTFRYALESSAGVTPQLFAKGSMESIGVDNSHWVRENLGSERQVYRANLATTIMRTAYGEAAKKLKGIDIELIDRLNYETRTARELRAAISILRSLFLGNHAFAPMKGDISDEIWSRFREQGITEHEWMEIVDVLEDKSWGQSRRTELSFSTRMPFSDIERISAGQGMEKAKDVSQMMLEEMRSLVMEKQGMMSNGGFVTLTFYVPSNIAKNSNETILSRSIEVFASALSGLGSPKVLTRVSPAPNHMLGGNSVMLCLREEQAGTNILDGALKDAGSHEKRVVIENLKAGEDQERTTARRATMSYRVLLKGMIRAHEESGHRPCVKDSKLILAYYRNVYSSSFGHQKRGIGGSNRPIEEINSLERLMRIAKERVE